MGEQVADADLRQLFGAIRLHPEFEPILEGLRNRFSAYSIGYAQARDASLSYLRSAFEDARRAKVQLGQPINVLENKGRHVVERRAALGALESWWSNWPATSRPFVLLGEEGMGKTWALASWLGHRLVGPDADLPLTLFLPSWSVGTTEALDLIARALAICTQTRDAQFWARRAKGFVDRSKVMRPALLVVLDGLNEQPLFDWRTLLEALQVSPWKDQVALVLTCRPGYWRDELGSGSWGSFQVFEIGPYDDEELASALSKAGYRAADLPSTLEPLLRRPRYLALTVRYRQVLEESGDVTVDRLLYEDWKDRTSRKRGLLSDRAFQGILAQLAEDSSSRLFRKQEIQDLIRPHSPDLNASLDEIITGGIMAPNSPGRFKVEPRRLEQGLGLLLADEVRKASGQGEAAMQEAMAALLEPDAGMDRKVAICRSAATFAVYEPGFPEAARVALLERWVTSQTLSREDVESFIAYLPAATASYLWLVERFWRLRRANPEVQTLLVRAFSRWSANGGVRQAVRGVCEKWLSYVHPYGFRFIQRQDDASRAKLRREIEERAGRSLKDGEKFLLLDELEVVGDEDTLWLSKPALLLASLFPVAPFVPALRRWALSRSVMGRPQEIEIVAWILRRSSEDLWPALQTAIGPLLDGPRVAQQAARRLLWASGREEAAPIRERLAQEVVQESTRDADDPCLRFWRREDCVPCAARPDIPDRLVAWKLAPHAVNPDLQIGFDLRPRLLGALSSIQADQLSAGRQMTEADHDFREFEPTLAAFAPDLLADMYRTLVRDLPNRSKGSREALLSELDIMILILGSDERRILKSAWVQLCRESESWDDETQYVEAALLAVLLFHVSARAQLDLFLQRPEKAFDDLRLVRSFKKLSVEQVRMLAHSLLTSTAGDLKRKLAFLWFQPAEPVVEALGAERLVELLDYPDSEVSTITHRWLFRSGADEVLDLAIERGKINPSTTRAMLQFWGRWFAVRMRSRLPYETLARAIDLGSLSYVVRKRRQDLAAYTRDLDSAFRGVTSFGDETLKTDFCKETFQAIARQEPEVARGWARLAIEQRDARSPLIEVSHMMLETLCEVLLDTDPVQGVELFQTLIDRRRHARTVDNPTGVDVLSLTLFRAHPSAHVETLLRAWLDNCTTDKALFELALAASAVRKPERLSSLVQQQLSSSVPVVRAVGLTLAGFAVHGSQPAALLDSVHFHPEGWLHEVQRLARRHLERDRWAQEWFRRFVARHDTDEAFAAFRLFLRCVDRRYWVWKDEVLKGTRLSQERQRYLAVNHDRINKAIKENEKELEKRFVGHPIAKDEVYPWLERYLG